MRVGSDIFIVHYQLQWRRQLVGTWARAPLAFENFFFAIRWNKLSGFVWYYAKL